MARHVPMPDEQHVMLEALNKAIDSAIYLARSAGASEDDIEGCFPSFNEETGRAGYESVVFTGSPEENGYDDPDEFMEIVNMVGSRDLDIKINEAKTTLNNLNELMAAADEAYEEEHA